nr:hypothetical protein [Clostridia bacterium]
MKLKELLKPLTGRMTLEIYTGDQKTHNVPYMRGDCQAIIKTLIGTKCPKLDWYVGLIVPDGVKLTVWIYDEDPFKRKRKKERNNENTEGQTPGTLSREFPGHGADRL